VDFPRAARGRCALVSDCIADDPDQLHHRHRAVHWRADQAQNFWESDYLRAAEYARFLKTDYDQAKAIFIELGLARKDI
jgi:tripartite-type tricarboxylate transporter receptor subunit TctC